MSRVLVAGLGNELRGDDGVGPAVARRVASVGHPGLEVIVDVGEPADLIEAWRGAELAIVVDAMDAGVAPGTTRRIDAGTGGGSVPMGISGHALPLPNVVELARALDALPGRLLVFAVQGADFRTGTGLSAAVAAVVDGVADAILAEVVGVAAGFGGTRG